MRGSRLLLILALLLPASFQAASSTFAAGTAGVQRATTRNDESTPMSGSVIVRDTSDVSAASTDFASYAANRYIVTFADSVDEPVATTDKLAKSLGFEPTLIYTARIRGFAAKLTTDQVASLERNAAVAAVDTDDIIPAPSAFDMPTGVERIGTLANTTAKINGTDERVNVDVAVIDSGIDFGNSDLNIANWFDCTSSHGNGKDEIGHGTHVAGTIGAFDDGSGVTGVAPGARIWPIKIFKETGGLESWAICGVETATDFSSAIEVANLSWGWRTSNADGSCSNNPIHRAICDAYNAGITLVAASGNQASDTSSSVPATFSQVITVSAFVDTDGKIGGKGGSTSYGCDDCFANFSNYGSDIDLAAPGVNILSTCPSYLACNAGPGLAVMTGTSMSAPHVSGAAALYIARNGRVGPSKVRSALISNSDPMSLSGDPDGIHERVLYVGYLKPTCSLAPTSGSPGATTTITCKAFRATEPIGITLETPTGTSLASATAGSRGSFTADVIIPKLTRGTHTFVVRGKTSKKIVELNYSVKATFTRTPTQGPAGTTVSIAVSGFGASETLTVRLDPGKSGVKTLLTGVKTSSIGTRSFSVTIPLDTSVGTHRIEVSGSAGSKVARDFTVTVDESPVTGAEATPTATATPSPSPTGVPEETATPEATAVATETVEPSPTVTETPAATETPTVSEPEPTATATAQPEVESSPSAESSESN